MKIGIIVAMRKELDLLLPLLHDSEESHMSGFEFHCGKMGGHDVMVMQCGIGKVNAAMGALMLVNNFSPNYVINTGVAGGADKSVSVMDVVAGARVAYHDVWCGPESELGRVQGLPLYFEEGKTSLVIAVGCTGGRHRSVVMAKAIGEYVAKRGYPTVVNHRDIERG